ncbi:pyridoxamine 5'-phosphate oxidase family protein [Neolewinella antarctica]|uniref:General stress protein 26 n=1 Tax=Neolewinella antarctica TaxID=442734 RepID=A0ABX0XFW1_9BACT|nr:pyridoxamine 5'-phosphate oxidase family protein [Neolewinella antarctica]NJC28107.1 general stress protein 26 [Neolewinella antarctica]
MGDIKNLINKEAIVKIQKLATDVDITMFCTNLGGKPFSTCPMSTQQVEDDGTIWFFSNKNSDHNKDIKSDPATQLIYSSKAGDTDHLSVYGTSEITFDRAKAEELFTPMIKTWFPEGVDDPELTMIKFTPSEGYYWDTKNGQMVAFAKMMASVVTGKEGMDDGIEGKLKVN